MALCSRCHRALRGNSSWFGSLYHLLFLVEPNHTTTTLVLSRQRYNVIPPLVKKSGCCRKTGYAELTSLIEVVNLTIIGIVTHGSQFGYSITEVFLYLTLSLSFVFYLVFFFIFYLLCKESELSLKDPAIEEVLESGSAELYLTLTPILVILFMTTPSFALL